MIKAYLKYRKNGLNEHGLHSPFVFEFYNEIIKKAKSFDDSDIQSLRKSLLKDKRELTITDLGAGSKKNPKNNPTVAQLTKNAAISRKYGKLLGRLIDHYKLETCLELGTSVGIGTLYLSKNKHVNKTVTIEGCEEIYKVAKENFEQLGLSNIYQIQGEFSDSIELAVKELDRIDLIYIDGNHAYQPTMDYFERLLEYAHNDTFIIFDDIHWSEEMEKAWGEICASPKINLSIELFRMGIVVKRSEQAKQHFILKY